MDEKLKARLNGIIDRITSPEFLTSSGLGNEIEFYIFDYPPGEELEVRRYVQFILETLAKKHQDLRVAHINLFRFTIGYLKDRNLYDRALQVQKTKGDDALRKALKGPLNESRVAQALVEAVEPTAYDLVIMTGVGNAWPLLRSHTLLSNLHPLMNGTPLVVFYPGIYDGERLSLFGRLGDNNYYRAFRLVP
jgi:hypothetical protein